MKLIPGVYRPNMHLYQFPMHQIQIQEIQVRDELSQGNLICMTAEWDRWG